MTHAINSNTKLLSIDITTNNAHTQMRKSSRGEKESGKEMRRDRVKKKEKENKKDRDKIK